MLEPALILNCPSVNANQLNDKSGASPQGAISATGFNSNSNKAIIVLPQNKIMRLQNAIANAAASTPAAIRGDKDGCAISTPHDKAAR